MYVCGNSHSLPRQRAVLKMTVKRQKAEIKIPILVTMFVLGKRIVLCIMYGLLKCVFSADFCRTVF